MLFMLCSFMLPKMTPTANHVSFLDKKTCMPKGFQTLSQYRSCQVVSCFQQMTPTANCVSFTGPKNLYVGRVYKFNKLKRRNDFSFQFRKIITRYRRIGYNLNVMRQSACLVLTQLWLITMLPSFITCRWVGWPRLKAIHFYLN